MKILTDTRLLRALALLLTSLAVSSCGDDPELVRKREQQKAEILLLDGELKILQEKIAQLPPDRASEIAKMKHDSELQQEEIAKLEQEIASLQKDEAQIEKDHEAYRRKYIVR
jgi:chromosome segregation ATPase